MQEQYGFIILYSTYCLCMLKSKDDWHSAYDSSEMVSVLFIELNKAFDKVDYSFL